MRIRGQRDDKAVKIILGLPQFVEDFIKLWQTKEVEGTLSVDKSSLFFSAPSNHFSVMIPIKDVIESLGLDLPVWAREKIEVPKIVEKIIVKEVEKVKEVERLPAIDKCSQCGRNLKELSEVILLTETGTSLLGSFCSDKCLNEWRLNLAKVVGES